MGISVFRAEHSGVSNPSLFLSFREGGRLGACVGVPTSVGVLQLGSRAPLGL